MSIAKIEEILGGQADDLLNHTCTTIPKEKLHLPTGDWVDHAFGPSDRNIQDALQSAAYL